jgi:DNA-binding GntR family transcriptional regulator
VFVALRDAIIAGQLAPGSRLTEAALCAQYGLSTTPVREALQKLVHRGLAVRHTARGVSVRQLSPQDIRNIYELRLLLEPVALQQSVPNLSDAELAAIGQTLIQAEVALQARDYLLLSGLNDEFHTAIIAGTPNRLLLQWIGELGDQRRLLAVTEWALRDRASRELQEHLAIHRKMIARKAESAAELLRRHIQGSAEPLLEAAHPSPTEIKK